MLEALDSTRVEPLVVDRKWDIHEQGRRFLIVMVHGFNSASDGAWGKFPELIAKDKDSSFARFNVLRYGYNSSTCSNKVGIKERGDGLASFLKDQSKDYDGILFVSHSMGGLVVMHAVTMMARQHDKNLERMPLIVMTFGTPHLGVQGAELLESLGILCTDKQAETMKVFNPSLSDLRTDWDSYFGKDEGVNAKYHVSLKSYYGADDFLVYRDSACGRFFGCEQVDGNHATMIKPSSRDDMAFKKLVVEASLMAAFSSTVGQIGLNALEKPGSQQSGTGFSDVINFNSNDHRKSSFMIGYCPGKDCFEFQRAEILMKNGIKGQVFLLSGGGFVEETQDEKSRTQWKMSYGRLEGGLSGTRVDFVNKPPLYFWDDEADETKPGGRVTGVHIALWIPLIKAQEVKMKGDEKDVSLHVVNDSINDIHIRVEVAPGSLCGKGTCQ